MTDDERKCVEVALEILVDAYTAEEFASSFIAVHKKEAIQKVGSMYEMAPNQAMKDFWNDVAKIVLDDMEW